MKIYANRADVAKVTEGIPACMFSGNYMYRESVTFCLLHDNKAVANMICISFTFYGQLQSDVLLHNKLLHYRR
jgi:hypothetical protein